MHVPRPITALSALLLVFACKSSTDGPVATSLQITPSPVTLASLGATQQLTATVLDQNGDPMTNVTVTWSSSAAGVATVSSAGLVAAVANGAATITASAGSLSNTAPVTVAQVVATIAKLTGDGQSGTVGQALAVSLRVRLNDANGNRVGAVPATFAVTSGGGQVSAGAVTADAQGEATTSWTLGNSTSVAHQVTVTSGTAPAQAFSAIPQAGAAAAVVKIAGDNQTAATGTTVAVAPRVRVDDSFGNRKPNTSVTFQPTAGSGSVTVGTVTTDGQGEAQVGSWTLDAAAGPDTLVATVGGTAIAASFGATAVMPGAPANIVAFVGDNQTALVGYATNVRPAVRVTDANNFAVANVSVTFAVASGGGGLQNATVMTNASGIAQVGSWTVGGAAGSNTMTATATPGGINGNPVTFTASGANPTYNITIRNIGPAFSPAAQLAFDSAVAKWQRVIYQDLVDIPLSMPANSCFGRGPAVDEVVDDIMIFALLDSIDGPGQVLGSAGFCFSVRTAFAHPIIGLMRFDTADVAGLAGQGLLDEVILHEMGHVLGYSQSMWDISLNPPPPTPPFSRDCLQLPASAGTFPDTHFACTGSTTTAIAVFDSIGGASYTGGSRVPIENCATGVPASCGPGTFNSHWREATFFNELMTGYLNAGVNPFSVLTIAAMGDINYTVNYGAADAYVRVFMAPGAATSGSAIDLTNDEMVDPVLRVLDRNGRVVGVVRRR